MYRIGDYVINGPREGGMEFPGYYIDKNCGADVIINNYGSSHDPCGVPLPILMPPLDPTEGGTWRPNFIVTWAGDLGVYEPSPAYHILIPGKIWRKTFPDTHPGVPVPVVIPGRPVITGNPDQPRPVPFNETRRPPVVGQRTVSYGPDADTRPRPVPIPGSPGDTTVTYGFGGFTGTRPTTWPPIVTPIPGNPPLNPPRPVDPPLNPPRPRPWNPARPGVRPVARGHPRVIARSRSVAHRNQPPGRNVKERKAKARTLVARMARVAFSVTEGLDIVDALWDALPKEVRNKVPKTGITGPTARHPGVKYWSPQDKLQALYRHIDELDLEEAIKNLIKNHIEDEVYGRLSGGGQTGLKRAGATTQHMQGTRQYSDSSPDPFGPLWEWLGMD